MATRAVVASSTNAVGMVLIVLYYLAILLCKCALVGVIWLCSDSSVGRETARRASIDFCPVLPSGIIDPGTVSSQPLFASPLLHNMRLLHCIGNLPQCRFRILVLFCDRGSLLHRGFRARTFTIIFKGLDSRIFKCIFFADSCCAIPAIYDAIC